MNIQQIKQEIEEFKALLNDPSVPQDEKDFAKEEIADLEAKLAKAETKPTKEKKPAKEKKQKSEKKAGRPKKAGLAKTTLIKIHWHEGTDEFNDTTFSSWNDLQKALEKIYDEEYPNGEGSGYTKVKLEITWDNGMRILDRIDVGNASGDFNPKKQTIGEFLKEQTGVMYESNLNVGDREKLQMSDDTATAASSPAQSKYMFKGKSLKDLTETECDELRKAVEERRKAAAKSEKKSKSKPVIEKISANVATAVKQAINSVSLEEVKENPKKEIERFEKLEKAAKSFVAEMRTILGDEYDKESVADEFKVIEELIEKLRKKYSNK